MAQSPLTDEEAEVIASEMIQEQLDIEAEESVSNKSSSWLDEEVNHLLKMGVVHIY